MDFAAIDKKFGLRHKDRLKARANTLGFSHVSQFVFDRYCTQDKRPKEIARELGVPYQNMYRWLAAWGFASIKNMHSASFWGKLEYVPLKRSTLSSLWVEVMTQAIKDIEKKNKHAQGARLWMDDAESVDCPSFIWVAEFLGLDPTEVRKAVLNQTL